MLLAALCCCSFGGVCFDCFDGVLMAVAILTVTLNPTLDISTSVARLIDHVKLRCGPEREQVGGGGINVAQVIASLGGRNLCQAMLPIGGSRGHEILQRLQASGLDCVTATINQQNRQCFTVYETETGHEYRFVLAGPTLAKSEQDACVAAILENLPTSFLVLSGSLPPGVPENFYASVISAVRQVAPGLRIVVDTSGAPLLHALDAGVFLFKPSREEFGEIYKSAQLDALNKGNLSTSDTDACIAASRTLIANGKTEVVALTLGSEGALIVTGEHAWVIDPLPVKVTSTVGAGDSFVGGLVWALLQASDNPDWVQAARVGTAAAGAALQTQGELRFDASAILAMSQTVQARPLMAADNTP